jgi:hypothetical protein
LATLAKVKLPSGVWKAPMTIFIVGRMRKSSANAAKGSRPSQLTGSRLRNEAAGAV